MSKLQAVADALLSVHQVDNLKPADVEFSVVTGAFVGRAYHFKFKWLAGKLACSQIIQATSDGADNLTNISVSPVVSYPLPGVVVEVAPAPLSSTQSDSTVKTPLVASSLDEE